MPSSDYAIAGGGGVLKLKGGGGIDKKRKKKKPKPTDTDATAAPDRETKDGENKAVGAQKRDIQAMLADEDAEIAPEEEMRALRTGGAERGEEVEMVVGGREKTEAERRYEERRRRRLDERLRREGVKTHKERVEELNRYLSRLSEHHDMPRIGPG